MTRDADALAALEQITQAQYTKARQTFARLINEENTLRAELARLDKLRLEASRSDPNALQMQAIGADVIWLGWIGRAKTALNLRLAQVLAQKEQHLGAVRRAYGKVLVTEQLSAEHRKEARAGLAEDVLTHAIEGSLFSR